MKTLPSELRCHTDRETGATIRQFTHYKAHSHHLYFTNPGWWDQGRRMVFGSDRDNRTNLFSLHRADGALTQLTDTDFDSANSLLNVAVNPARDEACLWQDGVVTALDLRDGTTRPLWRKPDRFAAEIMNVTADGDHVCVSIMQYGRENPREGLLHGYVGFEAIFHDHPLCRIMRIHTRTGAAEIVHEDRCWIGHVNTSPTQPHLLTFCHEGPWRLVQQRIWCLDLSTGRHWPVRPQATNEQLGHEYWLADGLRVGYHGHLSAGPVYGIATYDNSTIKERPFPHGSHHFHSLDENLIVGDGAQRTPHILLWKREDEVYAGPKRLCRHNGSRHVQQLHVHPRFTPDGRSVVYTADPQGYGQVFEVDVPPFESLPDAT